MLSKGSDSLHSEVKRTCSNKIFAGALSRIAENYDWNANLLRLMEQE